MKTSFARCAMGAVAALSIGAVLIPVTPALAATTGVVVAAGGSDTTDGVLGEIFAARNNSTVSIDGTSTTAKLFNIPAFSSTGFIVPGETNGGTACANDVTWVKDPLAPASNTAPTKGTSPFGSTAGRRYLVAENGGTGPGSAAGTDSGCLDVARSSSAPGSGAGTNDRPSFEYYAFGLDALSWGTLSLKAPGTLTHAQLIGIYNCSITNWSQVGGQPGQIVRYIPQPGSGTRSFFISDILGGATPNNTGACAGQPALRFAEENSALEITAADAGTAIIPYSAALWNFQANNASNQSLDKRCAFGLGVCARLGGIITTATTPVNASPTKWVGEDRVFVLDTTVVNETNVKQANPSFSEANGSYIGVRFVYNVLDNQGNRRGFQAAKQLLGFNNSAAPGAAKSPLCDNTNTGDIENALITSAGFAPLPPTANSTSNLSGSTCRFYAPTA